MSSIRIQRTNDFLSRRRTFQLFLNGKPLGAIAIGEIKEFIVPAGKYVLQAKMSWGFSNALTIHLEEESKKEFTVRVFKGATTLVLIIMLLALLQLAFVFFEQTKWIAACIFLMYPIIGICSPFENRKLLRLTEICPEQHTPATAEACVS